MEATGYYQTQDFPIRFSMKELGEFVRIVSVLEEEEEAVDMIAAIINDINETDFTSTYIAKQIYVDCCEMLEDMNIL